MQRGFSALHVHEIHQSLGLKQLARPLSTETSWYQHQGQQIARQMMADLPQKFDQNMQEQ